MKAIEAESLYYTNLKKAGKVDRDTAILVEEHLQRRRLAQTNRIQYRRLFVWILFKRSAFALLQLLLPRNSKQRKQNRTRRKRLVGLKVNMAKAAIHYLKTHMTPENRHLFLDVMGEYNQLIVKYNLAKKVMNPLTSPACSETFRSRLSRRNAMKCRICTKKAM